MLKIDRTKTFDPNKFLAKYGITGRKKVVKRQDQRALEITELDPADIKLGDPRNLETGEHIPLDAAILEALLDNQDQTPDCIRKTRGKGHTIPMSFDGTVLADEDDRGLRDNPPSNVDEYILYLYNDTENGLSVGILRCWTGRGEPNSDYSVVI